MKWKKMKKGGKVATTLVDTLFRYKTIFIGNVLGELIQSYQVPYI